MRVLKALLPVFLLSQFLVSQTAPLHSIDVTDLDRKVDPCSDFYEFSNGDWRASHPIPATMVRWSKRWESGETTKDKLKEILDTAQQDTGAAKGSTEQIIGDYYGACMDESRVNARGIEPLKKWFAEIDAVNDNSGLQPVIANMHDILVTVPFNLSSSTDPHRPTWVLADIGASGYALPDRDYYLKPDARFKEAREKYVEHIAKMFTLVGWDEKSATSGAQTVMAMETRFAEVSLDNVALRDPRTSDHNSTFAQLQSMAPHFDWVGYFKHNQIAQDVDLNVDQPKYMQEFDQQLQQTSLADWKVYLKWQVLHASANALSAPIVEEHFAFFGKYLRGQAEMKPRWKRCVEFTDQYLGEALGQKYTEKYFPPEAKARAQEMVRNILLAMRDDILTRPWMSDETKERAMAKIATFDIKVGYPDKWKDYSKVNVRRNTFFEDYLAGRRFVVDDDR
jgi:putative endopeptidase